MAESIVEQQVARVRAAIVERHGMDALQQVVGAGTSLQRAMRLSSINAHWAIVSDIPVIGGLVVLVRRTLRLILRWYINPIVDQQNAFNEAAVAALQDLEVENEKLRAKVDELERSLRLDRP